MSGLLPCGILLLALGIPCIVLGFVLKRDPDGHPGKKKKKGKKQGETKKQGNAGRSLILGGAFFSLVGLGFVLWSVLAK